MTYNPTFYIQTYGCQMNVNDSEWLSRSLQKRGFVASSFEESELYILNTCSVRDKPEQKVYSELGRITRLAKVHKRNVTICVGGCVAQQVGTDLVKRFPQVRLLFGTDGIASAPDALERLVREPSLHLNLLDFSDNYEERETVYSKGIAPATAFINIMQGCDNFCAYCIVPYVRGRQKSRVAEHILDECKALLEKGTREITLLGQNVNSYGHDREEISFVELLQRVGTLSGLERLRFMTPHPKDIASEVIDAFASSDVLCSRIHLPLQSGSNSILAAMGRKYTVDKYLKIVEELKKARPDIVFTTDIIVGFPGETEKDFEETLAVMKDVGYASSYSFVYSDRPKAKAVFLPGKVDREVSLERLSRLQVWQNQASEKILNSLIGKETIILLENKSQREASLHIESLESNLELTTWQGKTDQGFIVHVSLPKNNEKSWKGMMLPVTIESSGKHSLKGKQAGAPW